MQTLLLVDDDIAILKQLSFTFSGEFNVVEAQSREEAYKIIESSLEIDIALVDLGLPPYENSIVEGKLVVEKLLESTLSKVLILTGQESKEYPQELIEMGVFDYLQKPIEIPMLKQALQRASFFKDNESNSQESVKLSFKASLKDGLKGSADEAQKQLLHKILKQTSFNINQTSKILGISRENCYYFLKKFKIERPDV